MTTTLIVDGNNILIRAMKALERVPLSADGVPTGALHAFINSLAKSVRQIKPDAMAVCWDGGRSTYRSGLWDGYKAARKERTTEEEGVSPFALAKEFLALANIHHVEMPGVEADDLIAAYWHRRKASERLTILSGDKDFLQLLDGWTEQYRPGSNLTDRWTVNRVRSEMGCKPEHLPLVMALTGDSGDGVPGIPGFGYKTACKLLAKYDWSLEALLDAGEPKLFGHRDRVMLNLRLVNLREPIEGVVMDEPPRFAPTTMAGVLGPRLLEYLERYQMASIRNRFLEGTLWAEEQENEPVLRLQV